LEPPEMAVFAFLPLKLGFKADLKPYVNQAMQKLTWFRDCTI
jgi:hypothetical protein